jgi:hypothetical protein
VTLDMLAAHLARFPAVEVEIEDRTDPRRPHRRTARLLVTLPTGRPVVRNAWSTIWMPAASHIWPDDDDRTRDAVTAALSAAADSVRTEAGR